MNWPVLLPRVAYFGEYRAWPVVMACFDPQWPNLKIAVA